MTEITEKAKSILTLKKTMIDKLVFERYTDNVSKIEDDCQITFHHNIKTLEAKTFKITLGVSILSDAKYSIEAQLSGIFELSEDSVLGKKILENNTISILFPYLRSQLTLLSAQPGFEPIILPILNINALLNSER